LVRFRLKPDTSNSHEFELHRPSNKGTKLLLKVIKVIIIIRSPKWAFRSLLTDLANSQTSVFQLFKNFSSLFSGLVI